MFLNLLPEIVVTNMNYNIAYIKKISDQMHVSIIIIMMDICSLSKLLISTI